MRTPDTVPPLYFASAPYANQLPLAQFIPEGGANAHLLMAATPSRVLALLRDGSADAVLLPVAALSCQRDLEQIEGLGVCAMRQVRSVLLKCRTPLREVRTVETDPASLSSNALVRVLFRHLWKLPVTFVAPGTTAHPDAVVMIGDRALCAPPSAAGDIDLASAWHALTGLPFVFAVWVHRRGHPEATALAHIAHAALRLGEARLPLLATQVARQLGLAETTCLDYLTSCISFRVGDREREGMQQFLQMVAACPGVSRES